MLAARIRKRRGVPRRKFSDDDLRRAQAAGLSIQQTRALLDATYDTVTRHAKRLGISFRKGGPPRRWSVEDDALIRQVARGTFSLKRACRQLKIGRDTFRQRAGKIGARLAPFKPRGGTLVADGPIYRDRAQDNWTVGEDNLLKKLFEVHGTPRSDIYPGSDCKVKRFVPSQEVVW